MKKIFISQAMKGLKDSDIELVRNKAIEFAKEKYGDIEVIDSYFKNAPVNAAPLWFLGKSLELLSTADIALFVGDYENARGCAIEHKCAIEYGITTDYYGMD